ncbi:unnamed protein product [marine sediment metagenome]|uniref:Uncharacterized protein n=1 Tax=marine sediment metagenome TaxID=412755 RepID=X1E7H6_9ZZZZ
MIRVMEASDEVPVIPISAPSGDPNSETVPTVTFALPKRRKLLGFIPRRQKIVYATLEDLHRVTRLVEIQYEEMNELLGQLKAQYMRIRKKEKRVFPDVPVPDPASVVPPVTSKAELRARYFRQLTRRE